MGDSAPGFASGAWTGHVRFVPNYGGRATTADMWALELAPVSSLAAAVESVGGRELQRFSLAGGEIAIFACAEPRDARWAAWIGPWHMAHGLFYSPQWEAGHIAETFSRVRWTDTPVGMTVDGSGNRFRLEGATYLLPVAEVGTLVVQAKSAAGAKIPRWRGFGTPSGEIWRVPAAQSGGPDPLMFVTDTAVATLTPWQVPSQSGAPFRSGAAAGSAEGAFEFLRALDRIEWT
jgi:hypothetical protein